MNDGNRGQAGAQDDDATIDNWFSLAAAVVWQARIDLRHPDDDVRHSAERFMAVAHVVFDG